MENVKDVGVEFYDIVGRLFYAIVAADGVVTANEAKCLKRMVCSHWICLEEIKDRFDSCSPTEIISAFDYALFKHMDYKECFNQFVAFKNEHKELFTPVVNKLIWTTANVIAHSFPLLNRSEAEMLTKLQNAIEL